MTPEEAFRTLRNLARVPWALDRQDRLRMLEATDTLEQFISDIDPAGRRRVLAQAAERSQTPSAPRNVDEPADDVVHVIDGVAYKDGKPLINEPRRTYRRPWI
jgi:hypothetical protein